MGNTSHRHSQLTSFPRWHFIELNVVLDVENSQESDDKLFLEGHQVSLIVHLQ